LQFPVLLVTPALVVIDGLDEAVDGRDGGWVVSMALETWATPSSMTARSERPVAAQ
jgi:hypothetical protein